MLVFRSVRFVIQVIRENRAAVGNTLIFGSQSLLVVAGALFLLGAILVCFRYANSQTDTGTRLLGSTLKIISLLLISACLLEPLLSGQRASPGANLFLVLADNSQSLNIKDPGATATRGEQLRSTLSSDVATWQIRLAQDFDVRRYLFDTNLQNATDFAQLDFSGLQSNLIAVLNGLKDRFRNRPVAGVLVFTDGIATDARTLEFDPAGLPPIYPVVAGLESRGRELPDLAVSHLSVTSTAFEDAPVTIQADVSQSSLAKTKVVAQLVDEKGAVVKQETQEFNADQSPLPFRFQVRPTKPGVSFYEVRVRTQAESNRTESNSAAMTVGDPTSIESTLANNRRMIAIDRGSAKYRILYLSGRPNWEYKFLHRAIESDEQVQLTAVIRIAKKEPKFDWRSKEGESNNPLFKGFDGKTEETERYDQPVLIRLNTKSADELREGFPKSAEELYEYHAVIIDDLEAEFFSPDQLVLLERFVSERGGGLLMLGGAESYRNGGYDRTSVNRMLPFYLDNQPMKIEAADYRMALTKEGWLNPWARLRSTETEEQQRLGEMPSFQTLSRAGRVKPGATAIADVIDANGEKIPALAVQPFGRGRCAAMLIGDLWRWQIDRTDNQRDKDDLGKAWRQTIRWLIADVPDRIELKNEVQYSSGQPLMRIEARVRTKEFQPQDNSAVNIGLQLPDGSKVTQLAEPSLREPGLYESTFAVRQSGQYQATVDVVDHEGKPTGKAETGWTSDPAADEFARVSPNVEFLEQIAKRTSGEIVPRDRLESFVRSLPNRKAPLIEAYTTPIWHQPWVIALIMMCLCGEWALRRWKGLP